MMLWEMYTCDSVRAYHFDFHEARILEGIDDPLAWKIPDPLFIGTTFRPKYQLK